MKKYILITILLLFSIIVFGQDKSIKKIKIKKDTINVCGQWDWLGSNEGIVTSLDKFKLDPSSEKNISILTYDKSGHYVNTQRGDTAYTGNYLVDQKQRVIIWYSDNKVAVLKHKIVYFDNKTMLVTFEFEGFIVTYYFRRLKYC